MFEEAAPGAMSECDEFLRLVDFLNQVCEVFNSLSIL